MHVFRRFNRLDVSIQHWVLQQNEPVSCFLVFFLHPSHNQQWNSTVLPFQDMLRQQTSTVPNFTGAARTRKRSICGKFDITIFQQLMNLISLLVMVCAHRLMEIARQLIKVVY